MTFSELPQSGHSDRKIENGSFSGAVDSSNEMISESSSYSPAKKEEQAAAGNDVGALIAKSKKAAAYLFTLLHAKNCKLGPNRCSHPFCSEAKLMHLHLKTCTSESSGICPTTYKGCVDARKLFAHYRRCRDIRSRQTANQIKTQQHVCLVCSLVARSAKGSFERSRSTSPKSNKNRTHMIPSLKLSSDQISPSPRHSVQHLRVRPRSVSMPVDASGPSDSRAKFSQSPQMMPPPPPRFSSTRQEPSSTRQEPGEDTLREAVHRALNVPRSEEMISPANKPVLSKSLNYSGSYFRPRSESLDMSETHSEELSPESEELADSRTSGEFQLPQPVRRRRSASCHDLSSGSPSGGFRTIHEEPVGEEFQDILDGEK